MVGLLIRFVFTHSESSELVRQTHVEFVDNDFAIEGQEMTVSRAAVMAGLSREEVVRLPLLLEQGKPSMNQAPNRAERVV